MIFPFSSYGRGRRPNIGRGVVGQQVDLRQWDTELRPKDPPRDLRIVATPLDTLDRVETFAGLDLGQMHDPCALAVVRRHSYHEAFVGPKWPYLEVCRLHVWPTGPTGAKYRDVIEAVLRLRTDVLCYDYGGVGEGLVDTFRSVAQELGSQTKMVPVRTVGASNAMRIMASPETRYLTIPKVDLVTGLNVLAERRVVNACNFCTRVNVGDRVTVRVGNLAGYHGTVLELRQPEATVGSGHGSPPRLPQAAQLPQAVVSIDAPTKVGKRLCDLGDLYRSDPGRGCHHCMYLRFTVPDERMAKRLTTEMATFRERQGPRTKSFEAGGKGHHGDLVVSLALACLVMQRGRRELVWR